MCIYMCSVRYLFIIACLMIIESYFSHTYFQSVPGKDRPRALGWRPSSASQAKEKIPAREYMYTLHAVWLDVDYLWFDGIKYEGQIMDFGMETVQTDHMLID